MAVIGDRVAYAERQFSISRFLVAVISGQLAGSAISGALAAVAGGLDGALRAKLAATLDALIDPSFATRVAASP